MNDQFVFFKESKIWKGLINPHLPPWTAPFCLWTVPPLAGSVSVVRLLRAPMQGLTGCIYKWSSLLQPSTASYCYISMSASSSRLHLASPALPPSFSSYPLLHRPLLHPLPRNLCGKVLKEDRAICQTGH